ncbi:MAG: SDR family oxidoreductase [Thermodesulfovibrionales bacterium]
MADELHVVTGAFGFTGKYIARRLVDAGLRVRTITNSYERANPFKDKIKVFPYNFKEPEKLAASLRGATVLYNNYWVRFNHRDFSFARAVESNRILFNAAQKAGVKRIVQISITNPSLQSGLEYFRGKAKIERLLADSGIPYAILRPALIFGVEDVTINNIAWFLRKFPVFGIFGDGSYKLQPIHVDDLARLAIEFGQKTGNVTVDAIGPETFTYQELVNEIQKALGVSRKIVSIPPAAGAMIGSVFGTLLGDVVITRDEIDGLMTNLLCTSSEPLGTIKLSEWLKRHAIGLGVRYSSELARRKDRRTSYEKL